MSGEGFFPFDPGRLAALGRLSAEINATAAPPPIADPVLLDDELGVLWPVPDYDPTLALHRAAPEGLRPHEWRTPHAGLTLQWTAQAEHDGLLLGFRGGSPDGELERDTAVVFLTRRGLQGLIADLEAIDASLEAVS